ncbi:MAG: hypothetical protein [Microviridae sp.]|nr:MAG: hypothetical protein [Microviridae sp.]
MYTILSSRNVPLLTKSAKKNKYYASKSSTDTSRGRHPEERITDSITNGNGTRSRETQRQTSTKTTTEITRPTNLRREANDRLQYVKTTPNVERHKLPCTSRPTKTSRPKPGTTIRNVRRRSNNNRKRKRKRTRSRST